MVIGSFIFYFLIFLVLFSFSGFSEKKSNIIKFLAIPALLSTGIVFLSVIKLYFVYKILILVFVFVTGLLSYWQWGEQIRRWWC